MILAGESSCHNTVCMYSGDYVLIVIGAGLLLGLVMTGTGIYRKVRR